MALHASEMQATARFCRIFCVCLVEGSPHPPFWGTPILAHTHTAFVRGKSK